MYGMGDRGVCGRLGACTLAEGRVRFGLGGMAMGPAGALERGGRLAAAPRRSSVEALPCAAVALPGAPADRSTARRVPTRRRRGDISALAGDIYVDR